MIACSFCASVVAEALAPRSIAVPDRFLAFLFAVVESSLWIKFHILVTPMPLNTLFQ